MHPYKWGLHSEILRIVKKSAGYTCIRLVGNMADNAFTSHDQRKNVNIVSYTVKLFKYEQR